jgi:hypothetical protein
MELYMSDINLEEQRQEKMADLYSTLFRNVVCSGIGWIIFSISLIGLNYSMRPSMIPTLLGEAYTV